MGKNAYRLISSVLTVVLLLSLSGCGSSNSIKSYTGKTTIANVEKLVGEARGKNDVEDDCYSWMGYNSGAIFCGINCSELEFYFALEKKTLTEVYFEAVYEKTNSDAVDSLIKDLSKELGNPSIKKNTSSYNGDSYTEYKWENGTYVVLRDDGEVLSDIIIAEDRMREATATYHKSFDLFISDTIWPKIQEICISYGVFPQSTVKDLCNNKTVNLTTFDLNGDIVKCKGQAELTLKLNSSASILFSFSFEGSGDYNNASGWSYSISDVTTKVI